MEDVPNGLGYLKPEVRMQPLCFRWVAWSHLISPIQQALNITFRLSPLLDAYVSDPNTHYQLAADPEFLCGPIVHLDVSKVEAAGELLNRMRTEGAQLAAFARDMLTFQKNLGSIAQGFGVEGIYRGMPSSLAGLVEIIYDLNDHPSARFHEELWMESMISSRVGQEVLFCSEPDERRAFFLNTPRLDGEGRLFAKVAFDSPVFSDVSRSRIAPVSIATLADALGLEATQAFTSFFTSEPPTRIEPCYHGDRVRVRYFGHACVLVQTSDTSILVDPFFAWERDSKEASLTFADLPDYIDYVFLTHNHHDHFLPEVFLQLRNRIGKVLVPRNNPTMVADPSMKLALRRLGFENVVALDPMDVISFRDGYLRSIPFLGEHGDLDIQSKQTLFLEINGRRILLLADSSCADPLLYRRLASYIGQLDALFIGMECHGAPLTWLYEPYLHNAVSRERSDSRRLSASNCSQAWAVVEELKTRRAFVYAMGQEPWLKYMLGLQYEADSIQLREASEFIERCRNVGIEATRLYGCCEICI